MKLPEKEQQRRLEIYHRIYDEGGTLKDMAEEMFIIPSQVHRWIRANDLTYDRKKGNRLSKKEQERRLKAYKKFSSQKRTNLELANELGLHEEALRKWIRINQLVQLNEHYTKLVINPECTIWEHRDGSVCQRRKDRSYVRKRPKWEKDHIRHFAINLLNLNENRHVSVSKVMQACRKEHKNGVRINV